MKKIMIAINILFCVGNLHAQKIPESWYKENNSNIKMNKDDDEEQEKFGRYLGDVTETYQAMLEGIDQENNKSDKSWHLDEYRPLYSLSIYGLLGITGLKATSAVEQRWVKKTDEVKSEKEDNNEILLEYSQNDSELMSNFAPFLHQAKERGLISSIEEGQKQLLSKFGNIKEILSELASVNDQNEKSDLTDWKPTILRIDFSIGANGKVFTFAKIGAEFRVRTLWKIPQKSSARNKEDSDNSLRNLVQHMQEDIADAYNNAFDDEEMKNSDLGGLPFELESVGVGVGFEQETKWILAHTDLKADFFIIFNKVKSNKINSATDALPDGDYLIKSDDQDKSLGDIFRSKRSMMRKTMKKAMARAIYMSEKMAEKKKTHWTLEKIRVDYALQKTGFLGLAHAKAKVFTEILMKKKHKNNKENEKSFFDRIDQVLSEIHFRSRIFTAFQLPVIEIRFYPEVDLLFQH